MVYVEDQCEVGGKLEAVFESPFVFVVFDRNGVSRFLRLPLEGGFDAGWTFAA